jgi:hypothetical protein
MVVAAVAVAWRVEVHKVTRQKDAEVKFWFDQAGDATKRGEERIDSLSFSYRTQLESMKAAIDQLAEEIASGHMAQEPGPTLKELLRQKADSTHTSPQEAVRRHLSYHTGPQRGSHRHLLVISWFRGNGRVVLRYLVEDNGLTDNVRYIYDHLPQDFNQRTLSEDELKQITGLLPTLPESNAEPPIERTVLVSFQSGDKWRTETYDASKLPDEFEKVMLIIGERFETKNRHQNIK